MLLLRALCMLQGVCLHDTRKRNGSGRQEHDISIHVSTVVQHMFWLELHIYLSAQLSVSNNAVSLLRTDYAAQGRMRRSEKR